jgi:NhaA family Na+:H+ antiporter
MSSQHPPPSNAEAAHEGLSTRWLYTDRPVPRLLVRPVQVFLETEVGGGVLLLAAAVVALLWANSPAAESYARVWETPLSVTLGPWSISEDLRHWVNDLLMAGFFFVVGLEIKREIVHGDLRGVRTATLPVVAALGGMLVPAALYLAVNAGGPGARGWGVPMATDIAFALGALALLGDRAPHGLRLFLLTLAIVDDIGAITVIALFYTEQLSPAWLVLAAALLAGMSVTQRLGIRTIALYVVAAGLVWLAVYQSGVHATIAGVALGLLTPSRSFHDPEAVADVTVEQLQPLHRRDANGRDLETEQQRMLQVADLAHEAVSPLARFETKLHHWSSFLVLPLFALANAGVALSPAALRMALGEPVTLGIGLGLVLGKPLGVVLFSWLVVTSGLGRLPEGVGWRDMLGAGALAGIGFTVALFISGLAFADPTLADAAKIGILCASFAAGLGGALCLFPRRPHPETAPGAPLGAGGSAVTRGDM